MITVNGLFNYAHVMNDYLDDMSREQVQRMCDLEIFKNSQIRFMADIHAGKGAVIGTAMTIPDVIIPYTIGVDGNCGVLAYNLGKIEINFSKLDAYIKKNIPNGKNVNSTINPFYLGDDSFEKNLKDVSDNIKIDYQRVIKSVGSLGGGNHFIEIDKDENENFWLVIHSGSRNFGLQVANFHQNIAKKKMEMYCIADQYKGMEFLAEENDKQNYFNDMKIVEKFAYYNRETMACSIMNFLNIDPIERVESVHNFIDFSDNIIRKGAIRCYPNEPLLIPLNMRDGIIIGVGKSDEKVLKKWNYSAPHGAGRKLSRTKAKDQVSLDDFKKSMDGIWTSCVGKDTLDESPFAYKDSKEIVDYVKEIVDIKTVMKPVYNFKASE